ncbi:MAG: hypothetical protein HY059_09510 [Proteobacteria bacterium]|nr:hypothetical protein [Pseudomonadota bacterium]
MGPLFAVLIAVALHQGRLAYAALPEGVTLRAGHPCTADRVAPAHATVCRELIENLKPGSRARGGRCAADGTGPRDQAWRCGFKFEGDDGRLRTDREFAYAEALFRRANTIRCGTPAAARADICYNDPAGGGARSYIVRGARGAPIADVTETEAVIAHHAAYQRHMASVKAVEERRLAAARRRAALLASRGHTGPRGVEHRRPSTRRTDARERPRDNPEGTFRSGFVPPFHGWQRPPRNHAEAQARWDQFWRHYGPFGIFFAPFYAGSGMMSPRGQGWFWGAHAGPSTVFHGVH